MRKKDKENHKKCEICRINNAEFIFYLCEGCAIEFNLKDKC